MRLDPVDILRETAEEIAAMMAEYVVESNQYSVELFMDYCPHCGKQL